MEPSENTGIIGAKFKRRTVTIPPQITHSVVVEDIDQLIKKKPGRPKKKITIIQTEIRGIIDSPLNEENILELKYPNSKLFKKLFAMYKAYTVNEVIFKFMKDVVQIVNQSHQGTTSIYVTLFCNKLPHYYCESEMSVVVKREDLEKIFKMLDKSNYKITFALKREFYRSVLYIIVYDCEMDKYDEYEVEIAKQDMGAKFKEPEDEDYPLKFTLPSKHFKSIISRTAPFSDTLIFQKNDADSLELTNESHQRVNINSSYRNMEKIKLNSSVPVDAMFTVTVPISGIKPFANLSVGENIEIRLDEHREISLMTEADKVKMEVDGKLEDSTICCVKIFADIKHYIK